MATYHTTGYYALTLTDQGFQISPGGARTAMTMENDSPDAMFRVSDVVHVTDDTGYNGDETIVGFTSDGVITSHPVNGYTLATSNTSYAFDQIVTYNTDAFPVCFVKGTLIETDRGAVVVESLVIGDKIIGSTGLRTVKWIGWRHYHAVSLRSPEQRAACLPVRILAGALGDNLPSGDLRVSPWHHLFIDGVLIRANDLLNGKSILQETNTAEFSYYHVELDQFDVIRAYGVYSESYADGGNRDFFQNVNVTTLTPTDTRRRLAPRPGFKALRKAADIAVIHAKIAARAETHFSVSIAA